MRDVILVVFANSTQAPAEKWAQEFFQNEPIILTVPGGGGPAFRAKAMAWAKTGDLYRAALRELKPALKDEPIGRRGLVTFSVGWAFADELLKFQTERDRLDAYLLLDGCHTPTFAHFGDMAARAANMDAFMVMAHSKIIPPFVSATTTNKGIFVHACKKNDANASKPHVETITPDYITTVTLPSEGITISVGQGVGKKPIARTWTKDPYFESESRGNLFRIAYNGDDAPTHCYIAWHVAKRLWRMLGEHWAD